MTIFLFIVLGFILFSFIHSFLSNSFTPEVGILLPYIGAIVGAILGYMINKNTNLKSSKTLKHVNNISIPFFLILGGIGTLFSGYTLMNIFLSTNSCLYRMDFLSCVGFLMVGFIIAVSVLVAGILGLRASK